MVLGNYLEMSFYADQTREKNEKDKDANLLCGDAIANYKTVQSFGHEDLIVEKYKDYLMKARGTSIYDIIKPGMAYGFSQSA